MQYLSLAETDFNLRLNRKDVHKVDGIPASSHFVKKDHIFNRKASFIIIEQIDKISSSRNTKKKLLKQIENFWVIKTETLKPKGLSVIYIVISVYISVYI